MKARDLELEAVHCNISRTRRQERDYQPLEARFLSRPSTPASKRGHFETKKEVSGVRLGGFFEQPVPGCLLI